MIVAREIDEIEKDQEELRKKIDRLPPGTPERERLIDELFRLHDRIDALLYHR